jgi:hypothetical protein
MKLSRREAARLQKRVAHLERILAGGVVYPGGTNLWSVQYARDGVGYATFRTARRLGFALVATFDDEGMLSVFAVKP